MPSKKDNPSDPTTKDDLIDNVIEKMGGDFAKIDIRETSEIMGDSEDVRDRAKEIEDLVTSKKKTREWADTQEKYIRTWVRNRQSPPKKKETATRPELPQTKKKSSPPKASPKGGKTAKKTIRKVGKNEEAFPTLENSDAKAFLKAANDRILAEKKENSYKEGIFEIVDSLALTVGKKKAFSKMSEMHAKYAAFISLPDAMQSLTDSDFVKHYKVFKNGPYLWKSRNDVSRAREFLLYEIMRRYTPLVLQNLATGAQRKNWNTWLPDPSLIKLFLQVSEKWSEKTQVELSGWLDVDIFTMDLPPSQFVKPDKIPKKSWEDDDDPDDDSLPEGWTKWGDADTPEDLDEVESL